MRKTGSFRKLLNVARLARDEEGTVLIYVSIALTVFMGFAALVIDGSRLFTLDTEMQSASDAIALAGAAELDGTNDAITRANRAMDNLVRNYETFGDSGTAITGYTARFLTALPADDSTAIPTSLETTDGPAARFVEVRLQQEPAAGGTPGANNTRSISNLFASAIGAGSTESAGATSVAGFTSAVCKFTPLFMCNPYSSPSEFLDKVGKPAEKRKIIALKQSNGGSGDPKYGPGNFGFLATIDDSGANFKESLAKTDPGACFSQRGVNTEPGNKVSSRTALNTRFDMYEGNFNKHKNDIDYRPARNVTKGMIAKNAGQVCKPDADTTVPPATPVAMAFPSDSNITDTTRIGNGDWAGKFDTYWSVNHPGVAKPNGWSSTNLPSRYDVYRWEIETNHIPNNSSKSPKGENGNPQCSNKTPNDTPDRRILYAAIIDCATYGDMVKGRATGIPVIAFAKMFMTQPMTKKATCTDADLETVDCNDTLFVEMIDIVEPGIDDAVIHDIVQLYR